MNDVFIISKLIIKKKLKVLKPSEKSRLKQLNQDYPFSKNIDFIKITTNLSEYSKINKDKAWVALSTKIDKGKRPKTKLRFLQSWFKYAAIFVLFLGLGYVVYQKAYFYGQKDLIIPEEQITLQLENGELMPINEKESTSIFNAQGRIVGNQSGRLLIYTNTLKTETLTYNTLTVPYGKRFEIQLSDGTKVTINAGSSLRYPVKFLKGQDRQVFLNGEAFFDVSADTEHPFIVNTEEINVRVLGTKFNISSYPEDKNINTVLVEGVVVAYKNTDDYLSKNAVELKPNHKASWHKQDKIMQVSQTDIEPYIAWMRGRLILHEVSFHDMLKKLERQYNVIFINNNQQLENRYFTAKFDVEDIHQVLQSLSVSGNFTYKFDQNKIIINP